MSATLTRITSALYVHRGTADVTVLLALPGNRGSVVLDHLTPAAHGIPINDLHEATVECAKRGLYDQHIRDIEEAGAWGAWELGALPFRLTA